LLAYRELDDALGLSMMAGGTLAAVPACRRPRLATISAQRGQSSGGCRYKPERRIIRGMSD